MKNGKTNCSSLKELHTFFLKGNISTIDTKYNKYGNKVLMFETVREVDGEKVIKENNTQLTSETNS